MSYLAHLTGSVDNFLVTSFPVLFVSRWGLTLTISLAALTTFWWQAFQFSLSPTEPISGFNVFKLTPATWNADQTGTKGRAMIMDISLGRAIVMNVILINQGTVMIISLTIRVQRLIDYSLAIIWMDRETSNFWDLRYCLLLLSPCCPMIHP